MSEAIQVGSEWVYTAMAAGSLPGKKRTVVDPMPGMPVVKIDDGSKTQTIPRNWFANGMLVPVPRSSEVKPGQRWSMDYSDCDGYIGTKVIKDVRMHETRKEMAAYYEGGGWDTVETVLRRGTLLPSAPIEAGKPCACGTMKNGIHSKSGCALHGEDGPVYVAPKFSERFAGRVVESQQKEDARIATLMEAKNAEFHERHKQAIKDAWAATSQLWTPADYPLARVTLARGGRR